MSDLASSSNALGQWSPETGPPFVKHLTMWSDPKCVDHTGPSVHARDHKSGATHIIFRVRTRILPRLRLQAAPAQGGGPPRHGARDAYGPPLRRRSGGQCAADPGAADVVAQSQVEHQPVPLRHVLGPPPPILHPPPPRGCMPYLPALASSAALPDCARLSSMLASSQRSYPRLGIAALRTPQRLAAL